MDYQTFIQSVTESVDYVVVRLELAWKHSLQPALELLNHVLRFLLGLLAFLWQLGGWKTVLVLWLIWHWPTLALHLFALATSVPAEWYLGWFWFLVDTVALTPADVIWRPMPKFEAPPPPVVVVPPPVPVPEPRVSDYADLPSQRELGLLILVCVQFVIFVFLILKPRRVLRVCEHGFMVEKTVQGSEFISSEAPNFIAEIWGMTQGTWTRRGTCFRVGPKIYTAGHVLVGCDKVKLRYNGFELAVEGKWNTYDMDLVATEYEPFSSWQMGAGKFVKRTGPAFVAIHNGSMQAFGRLKPSAEVGFVEFDGSTTPGFSGAPYYAGNAIYGMHLGAGVLNLGFDGAFISSLVSTVVVPEADSGDTDPYSLMRAAEREEELEYRYMGNDYVSVKTAKGYRTFSEYDFERVMRNRQKRMARPDYDYEADIRPETVLPAMSSFTHRDEEPVEVSESGNVRGLAVPVTAPAGPVKAGERVAPLKPTPLQRQQPHTPSPSRQQTTTKAPTSGLTSQAVLQKLLSPSTSSDMLPAHELALLSKKDWEVYRRVLQLKR